MRTPTITRLFSGGLVTTYFCPSKCRHCLYNCGPSRSRDSIDPDRAGQMLRKVREMGCRSVHVGGGEPLLEPEKLGRVLEKAREAGVGVDYVETNCSWYRDRDSAAEMLENLRDRGLSTLLVSISPFHNEHIPAARITGAMEAADRAGVSVLPWVSSFLPDLRAFDPHRPHSLEEYRARFGENYVLDVLNRYWIHFGGRSLETFRPLLPGRRPEQLVGSKLGRCSGELLDTSHFHVDLYGNYIPGLCSGLAVDMNDLGRPLLPESYPLLNALFRGGVGELWELAQRRWGFVPQRQSYLCACDLCTEIRTFLVRSGYDESSELRPLEFYDPRAMAVQRA
jgi:hypothetical protein